MKICPACSELGIGEHSVLIRLDPPREEPRARALGAYTQCAECGAAFWFANRETLEREPPMDEPVAWIVPPWTTRTVEAEFELSWDNAERHFRSLARKDEPLRTMVSLLGDLRGSGLGSRLRADVTSTSLVLSRASGKGVQAGKPYVALRAEPRGAVKVKARLARELKFGPVPASYGGDLKLVVDALLSQPIE